MIALAAITVNAFSAINASLILSMPTKPYPLKPMVFSTMRRSLMRMALAAVLIATPVVGPVPNAEAIEFRLISSEEMPAPFESRLITTLLP